MAETLTELAFDVERQIMVAFSDCPSAGQDSIVVEYFLNAITDAEVQLQVRISSPSSGPHKRAWIQILLLVLREPCCFRIP